MKWFKHDSNANADSKLQNVLLDYGLEGYGLYWYCIELIAGKVDADNITFSLEHDARIIARNTGSTAQKVEEMMRYFVSVGLFENSDGMITCMKMARRLDQSMTSNKAMRAIIDQIKAKEMPKSASLLSHSEADHDEVMINHDEVMKEEMRLEETRKDTKDTNVSLPEQSSDRCPHNEIIKAWSEILPELRQPRVWDGQRMKDLATRWKSKDIDAASVDYWRDLFEYIRRSDFLMGRVNNFSASLDWVVKSANYNKIIEGKYHE